MLPIKSKLSHFLCFGGSFMFLLLVFHEFLELNRHFTNETTVDMAVVQSMDWPKWDPYSCIVQIQHPSVSSFVGIWRIQFIIHSASNTRRLTRKNTKCCLEHLAWNASICLMTNSVLSTHAKPQAEHTLNSSGVPRHFSSLTSNTFNFCVPSSTRKINFCNCSHHPCSSCVMWPGSVLNVGQSVQKNLL
jgi:hypothetical protein